MKTTDWRGTAELVGIAAIVASLVFVAFELRQANQLGRLSALESMASEWNMTGFEFANSEVSAEVMSRVLAGALPADLDEVENYRVRNIIIGLDRHWELRYKQSRLGVLEPEDYSFPRTGHPLYASPYHREFWPEVRHGFPGDFAKFWADRFDLPAD